MLHARGDYNHIQDPTGKIHEDEPVFLLRASDICAPDAVRAWCDLAYKAGASEDIIELALNHAKKMHDWQIANGWKIPDLPKK